MAAAGRARVPGIPRLDSDLQFESLIPGSKIQLLDMAIMPPLKELYNHRQSRLPFAAFSNLEQEMKA